MSNLIADNAELRVRVAELEAELDRTRLKLTNMTAERDQAQQAERRAQVGRRIAEAARKAGALDIALVDIEHRALQGDWREENGKLWREENGKLRLYESGIPAYNDRGEPVTDTVWVAGLKASSSHFFTPVDGMVQGGGQNKPVVPNEPNPFDHSSPHFNVTKQGQVVRANPAKARQFAIAAGWDERRINQMLGEPSAA
jgi:hypothetical protein